MEITQQPGVLMHQKLPMLSLAQQPESELHAIPHSTPLRLNGNQRENVVSESSQRDSPQTAQPAAPQVNDDDDDGNGENDVL